jgi:hypothetical protein
LLTQALPEYAEELRLMNAGGVKCELENLYSLGSDHLGNFLEEAILTGDYI